jgi:hypothetical protein
VELTTAATELIIPPVEITTAVIMLATTAVGVAITAAVGVAITAAVIGTANTTARVIIPLTVRSSLGFRFRFPFWCQAFIRSQLVDSVPPSNWIYEIKFDGYRALALRGGGETRVLSAIEFGFH